MTQHSDDVLEELAPIGAVLAHALPPVLRPTDPGEDLGAHEPAACPDCQGAGYYTERVHVGHPHFGVLFPCACKRAAWESRRHRDIVRLSNIDAFQDMSFATFDPAVRGVRRAYLQAREYAAQLCGWLALFGGYGVGKTHLAVAIAQTALQRDVAVIFAVVPDLLDHLRATFAPHSPVTYDERFELIRNAPLLILDDLGTESGTPWAREKLYQLINHRYNQRYATVFTSNQPPEQLDGRIFSRMCDPRVDAEIIRIDANDYRKRNLKPFSG